MRKRKACRLLSLLMVAMLVLSLLPATAQAASEDEVATETRTINLLVDETYTEFVEGTCTLEQPFDATAATVEVNASEQVTQSGPQMVTAITSGSSYYISDGTENYLSLSSTLVNFTDHTTATQWTIRDAGDGYYEIYTTVNGAVYYLNGSEGNLACSANYAHTYWRYTPGLGFSFQNQYICLSSSGWGLSHSYSAPGGPCLYVEGSSQIGSNVTITGVSVGETTARVTLEDGRVIQYVISVSEANTLDVELWITNRTVQPTGNWVQNVDYDQGSYAYYVKLNSAIDGITDENGVDISTLVPATGTVDGNAQVFWKATLLDSDHQQTRGDGVDQTSSGSDFTAIRFWKENWQVKTSAGWVAVGSTDQVVAYYYQETSVTDEVMTYVVDWGIDPSSSEAKTYFNKKNFAILDFQTQYPSGAYSNEYFPTAKTQLFHNNSGAGRTIGTIVAEGNNPAYYVKEIQVVEGTATYTNSTLTVSYDGTVTTVWSAERDGGTPTVESITFGSNTSGSNARLVRYVLGINPDFYNLKVHYINQSTGTEFHSYGIAAVTNNDGTVLDTASFSGWVSADGQPVGTWSITDVVGNEVAVYYEADSFARVPDMPSQYIGADFTFQYARVSADGTELYLYYDSERQEIHYLDFGLKFEVALKNTNYTLANPIGQYGKIVQETVDGATKYYYVPEQTMQGPDTFTLEDKAAGTTTLLSVVPATNVLYEDTFLTPNSSDSGEGIVAWQSFGTPEHDVQSTDDTGYYGYDGAYAESIGISNKTYWQVNLQESDIRSAELTTSFYGNGFDLIGRCSPETAQLIIMIKNANTGRAVKAAIVDTRFADTNVVSNATLDQVPLCHLELPEGSYTAVITAWYIKNLTPDIKPVINGEFGVRQVLDVENLEDQVLQAVEPVLENVENENLDVANPNEVMFYYADEGSPLAGLDNSINVVEAYGLDELAAQADEGETTETTPVVRTDGSISVIDGFRVYRSSSDIDIESEQGVTYVNVLDAVLDGHAGYIEKVETGTEEGSSGPTFDRATYESMGGPENEFYMEKGAAVTFQFDAGATVQISARAVTDSPTTLSDGLGSIYPIATNTEMYYTVKADTNGVLTITNTGEGMLGLGNLKIWSSNANAAVVLSEPTEETYAAAFALMRSYNAPVVPDASVEPEVPEKSEVSEEPEVPVVPVFEPGQLDIKVKSANVMRNKVVTVTITASTDVAQLVVNGKVLRPTNSILVKLGLSKTYTYVVVDKVKKTETKTYEIVAYNADGVASESYTVQG